MTARVGGGSPDRVARGLPTGGQGSKVYVLCAEPKEDKHFRPGTRPGGSVTRVTKKMFMCQMFMCFFRPLKLKEEWGTSAPLRRGAAADLKPVLSLLLVTCLRWVGGDRKEAREDYLSFSLPLSLYLSLPPSTSTSLSLLFLHWRRCIGQWSESNMLC